MNYKKHTWIGNKVSGGDMQRLYRLKQETGKHIIMMVAEAIEEYLLRRNVIQLKPKNKAPGFTG